MGYEDHLPLGTSCGELPSAEQLNISVYYSGNWQNIEDDSWGVSSANDCVSVVGSSGT